jgi:hypothetical protein
MSFGLSLSTVRAVLCDALQASAHCESAGCGALAGRGGAAAGAGGLDAQGARNVVGCFSDILAPSSCALLLSTCLRLRQLKLS